ncbi:hypothetical protein LEP1GSC125_2341 [Leptospira mayottensis 200901122]|uniref:Uncharacterized protein n=1 Tax=Leptospira mayottensis 200901122 TaxID=1193010 RepID=A0AA87SVG2_9LEPT|nr:hypothetical protein LEP1GSC125_2341 [Leptospira mayottensis 200901122]
MFFVFVFSCKRLNPGLCLPKFWKVEFWDEFEKKIFFFIGFPLTSCILIGETRL